jgi:EmrB/QacA subfamily drug resistance transporter
LRLSATVVLDCLEKESLSFMSIAIKPLCDEAIINSAPAPTSSANISGNWVLVATILGSSMAFIDGTVVNVALPSLQKELQATVAEVQWVVEAYSLLLSALILVGGSLGDHFGRRKIYAADVVLFTLASVGCGLSPNITTLIIARSIQGIGGALLVPGSLAIISASFKSERRGRAIGTWSGFTSITSAFGPALGGWLIDNVSWRAVFFLNLPLALTVLAITFTKVPESYNQQARKLEWWGAVMAIIGLGGIVYGLIEANTRSLSDPLVLTALLTGLVGLGLFVVIESRSRSPMMPLSLFRSPGFSGTNLLTLLLYGALGGVFFFVPFNLIEVQSYTPTMAGLVFIPFVLIVFFLSRWAGGLVGQYGARLPLIIGPLIAATGFGLFALPGIGGSYWVTFFPAVVVLGTGMAITIAPLTTTVMNSVDVSNSGIASGINNAVSRVAGLLAIALFGIFMVSFFGNSLENRLTSLNIDAQVKQNILEQHNKLAQIKLPADLTSSEQQLLTQAINEAFVDSFRLVILIATGLVLLSVLATLLLIEGKPKVKANNPETKH